MAVSFTGCVLGMQQMEVKPPAAAAREPLSMVSACSKPGSRRWTCMSMKPGATTRPVGVEGDGAGGVKVVADADDQAVLDEHVGDLVAARGRIDHASVLNEQFRHGFSRCVRARPCGRRRRFPPGSG